MQRGDEHSGVHGELPGACDPSNSPPLQQAPGTESKAAANHPQVTPQPSNRAGGLFPMKPRGVKNAISWAQIAMVTRVKGN